MPSLISIWEWISSFGTSGRMFGQFKTSEKSILSSVPMSVSQPILDDSNPTSLRERLNISFSVASFIARWLPWMRRTWSSCDAHMVVFPIWIAFTGCWDTPISLSRDLNPCLKWSTEPERTGRPLASILIYWFVSGFIRRECILLVERSEWDSTVNQGDFQPGERPIKKFPLISL